MDLQDGLDARDEAMRRVAAAADEAWKERANALGIGIVTGTTFIAEYFWEQGLDMPREPRALGPVIANLARNKVIAPTGRYLPSPRSHATPRREWVRV